MNFGGEHSAHGLQFGQAPRGRRSGVGRSPRSAGFKYHQGAGAGGVGAEPEQSPTLTAGWHNPAVYPIDEPITMADLNANTAIGYDMVGTLKVGGDAPSVCL